MMKNFALIGAAGYIAPRHMKAMKETGNNLVAAIDPNDSVDIIDSYFPDAHFFTEFEHFDRYIDKTRQPEFNVNFVSIASPDYLHDSHCRFALRSGADAICETPLLLNPWNIDALKEIESVSGKQIYTILQLRLHPSIISLHKRAAIEAVNCKFDVDLTFVTSRGRWYLRSWKGDEVKAGGIATNIGVQFFDMLHFVFGTVQENVVHLSTPTKAAGYLEYECARVRWFLSVDVNDIPEDERKKGNRTYRSIVANGDSIEFSDGFTDLHTRSYEGILAGQGFGLEDNRVAIETVSQIRTAQISTGGERHPFLDVKSKVG